jgi:hypothetical protein
LSFFYLVFLGFTGGINFLIESKIEKRKKSREYVGILLLHLTLLVIAGSYASFKFYDHCVKALN